MLDREWIVWTPEGYYETSAIGDRRYLGWHRNREAAGQPTDYFSFDHFEKELRRGDALRRFLATADRAALAAEVAAPAPVPAPAAVVVRTPDVVAQDLLPQVAILAPEAPAFTPVVVPAGVLPLRVRAATEDAGAGRGLIGRIRVQLDGAGAAEAVLDPPLGEANRELSVRLGPGLHRVSVTAWNDRAISDQRLRRDRPGAATATTPATASAGRPTAPARRACDRCRRIRRGPDQRAADPVCE